MGTNYYFHRDICPMCGKADETFHIGKSSYGWCFSLHVIPEEGINDLPDWEKMWESGIIADEYGKRLKPVEMKDIITRRGSKPVISSEWYSKNHAIPGPNGLARHKLDPQHCVKHGEGTWDCILGEFC